MSIRSPYLEKCCLLLSANESYARAAEDLQVLTGMAVSHSTQQRLVHRQSFDLPCVVPAVEEMSVDGGKVRLRTPKGEPSEWRDYKAVNLHQRCVSAFFQDNAKLVNWVNAQPLSTSLTCLGDGHDGIWNLYGAIGNSTQRREILDWYHLVENLGKVGGSVQRLDAAEACLWQGDVDGAIALFNDWQHERVTTFVAYLNKHRHRIVNYGYYQTEKIPKTQTICVGGANEAQVSKFIEYIEDKRDKTDKIKDLLGYSLNIINVPASESIPQKEKEICLKPRSLKGTDEDNIVNRTNKGLNNNDKKGGLQIELNRKIRADLAEGEDERNASPPNKNQLLRNVIYDAINHAMVKS